MWQIFLDIVQVSSQIITTLVSGFAAWIAYLMLLRTPEQQAQSDSDADTEHTESSEITDTHKIVVFHSSTQRTTLIATSQGLECHLFDSRPGKSTGLQWTLAKEKLQEIMKNNDFNVNPGLKLKTGTFSIGQRRNWLYSKQLHPNPLHLECQLRSLIESACQD